MISPLTVGGSTVSSHCRRPCAWWPPCPRSLQPPNLAVTGAQAALPVDVLGSPTYHSANFGMAWPRAAFLAFDRLFCRWTRSSRVLGIDLARPKAKNAAARHPGKHGLPLTRWSTDRSAPEVCRDLLLAGDQFWGHLISSVNRIVFVLTDDDDNSSPVLPPDRPD